MKCTVYYNDSSEQLIANKMTFFEEVYFDYKILEEQDHKRLSLFIHPKQSIQVDKVIVEIPYHFQPSDKILCNGFQSWSETKTYSPSEKIPQLRKLAEPFFQYYTDSHLFREKRPDLYSWTYGYVQQSSKTLLIGSVSESTAYTLIEYDTKANIIRITKLCDHITLAHSFPVFDLILSEGKEQKVFDDYFKAIGPSPKKMESTFGWTSWYRHYNKISESKILNDLESFSKHSNEAPFSDTERIFQIDDGYQTAIGDWLSITSEFPNGLSSIAHKIRSEGMTPGIWIAPFVCSKTSKIFAHQKDWLLKDDKKNPIKAGYNPLWGGWYYALDIYNPKVKDYLTEVFYTFFNKWGFQLVKADFLFAACIAPPKGKTKAQVMFDAMTFIAQLVGQNKLLACGIPLGSVFNQTATCRIGPDTHLAWTNPMMRFLRKRERVSTLSALRTIIHRRHLNKRVFINDPDVFIMRADGHKLSRDQQYTLLLVQVLFGSQIFNSDDWNSYDNPTLQEIKGLLAFREPTILQVHEPISDYYQIHFQKDYTYIAHINLNKHKVNIPNLEAGFDLDPFESIVLRKK